MGCLARFGCLLLLVALGCVAWFTRDQWMPHRVRQTSATVAVPAWQPVTDAGANRAADAIAKLGRSHGQAYQTLTAADLTSYVLRQLAHQMPASTDSIRASIAGDRVVIQANVHPADLGDLTSLGPLASMLGDREHAEFSGTLRVVSPGLAEFEVQSLKVREINVPRAMIPGLISRLGRTARPAGLDADALPLPIPAYIGDIRVANGKVTLYKTAG